MPKPPINPLHALLQRLYGQPGQILAIDFDGVLSLGSRRDSHGLPIDEWPGTGRPNLPWIEWFRQIRLHHRHRLILNTCRTGQALENALEFCHQLDLEFDAVNENLPDRIVLFGDDCRKISADVTFDDRAINTLGLNPAEQPKEKR